ncbi:hypothetical protein OEB96_20270 [Paraliomyxa miuraensis]|nr:hypothetical protein [Paraliomyxa miuraensis]
MLDRTSLHLFALAPLLLLACPADEPTPIETASGSSTGDTSNQTLTLSDPSVTVSDTTPDTGTGSSSGSSTAAVDSGSGSSTADDGSDSGSESSGEPPPPMLWERDFGSGVLLDPEDDDYGPGDYVYPMGVDSGSSDLRTFELDYTAVDGMLHFTLGLTTITENTRISMLLLDDDAWANAGSDIVYTVGGTEVRTPNWNDSGVQLILMDPASPLFDFGAINDIDPFSDNPRPDNAIYLREASGAPFLGEDGMPSYSTMNLRRLDVMVDTMADPNTMSFDVDATWLAPYLDTQSTNLYVAVWTYTLIDLPMDQWFQIEFGAVEITEALGGLPVGTMDDWRDCDAYDMMFFDGAFSQESFLDVPAMFMGDPANTVVTFENVDEGVLQVPTGA